MCVAAVGFVGAPVRTHSFQSFRVCEMAGVGVYVCMVWHGMLRRCFRYSFHIGELLCAFVWMFACVWYESALSFDIMCGCHLCHMCIWVYPIEHKYVRKPFICCTFCSLFYYCDRLQNIALQYRLHSFKRALLHWTI